MDKNANRRIAATIRSRLHDAVKNDYKTGFAVDHLGCTIEFLKQYLESKFQFGMSWENQGQWHMDHIVPLSKFNLSKTKELKKACHYTNLQPMWAKDNLRKNNKHVAVIKSIEVKKIIWGVDNEA